MFEELLEKYNETFQQANQQTRQSNKVLKQSKLSFPDPQQSILHQDPTIKHGNVMSFSKAGRFKELEKQQLKLEHIQFEKEMENRRKEDKGWRFNNSDRFQKEKIVCEDTALNPSLDLVKKNVKGNVPLYRKSSKDDMKSSRISVSTTASINTMGPAAYFIKEQKPVKNAAFHKSKRFQQEKPTYQDNPLFLNQNQTRKRPPSAAVLKKKIKKTKYLISKEQQQEMRQRVKMVYWQNISLELDRLQKSHPQGPVLRQSYFNIRTLKGRERHCAMLMLMDKLRFLRGGFEQNVQKKMEVPCGVVYRKSTPKPFKFSEMQPGPDYYHPTDELLHPTHQGFSFAKADPNSKKPETDKRDYEIDQQIFKKGGNIVINPEHKVHRLSPQQIRALNRGPGFYDCLFSQVEKRQDIGVIKFQQITEKNDRKNNCVEINQVCDGVYFPSFDQIDPNKPAPLYKEPANVKPQHLPEKQLFPEHWMYYDGDMNKVRAEIAKNVLLADGMSFNEYQVHIRRFNAFKERMQIEKKQPEIGQYQPQYTAIDAHIEGFEMHKKDQKTLLQPIKKPQFDADGDNLILNPHHIQSHQQEINFNKMVGRFEEFQIDPQQPKQGDRLILNPHKLQKKVPDIIFGKMEGRQQKQFNNQESPMGDVLILDPKPVEKHLPDIDFEKYKERQEIRTQKDQNEVVNVVNLDKKDVKIKGVPFSRLSSVRMIPLLRDKKSQTNEQQ